MDVIGVLEEVLPARFGDSPTEYQLVEVEPQDGGPCVRLLVHPRLGALDEQSVADTFLNAIGRSTSEHGRRIEILWRQAGILMLERSVRRSSDIGKNHHVFLERRTN